MNTVIEYLAFFSKSQPQKTAVVAQGKSYSYFEFYQSICGFSAYLKKLGIRAGERVLCKATASVEYFVACFGTQLAGGVFVPVEKDCSVEKMQSIMEEVNGVFAFLSNSFDLQAGGNYRHAIDLERIPALAKGCVIDEGTPFPTGEDTACILFTTGTTGDAKGVMIPHKYWVESGVRTTEIPYGKDAVVLIPVPLNHSFGLGRSIVTWVFGGTVVLIDGLTNLLDFYNALTVQKANAMVIAPSGLNYLVTLLGEEFFEMVDAFTFMEIGGEKVTYSLQETLVKTLQNVRLFIGYAPTETGMVCSYEFSKHGPTFRRIGKPIAKTEILTLNENGVPMYATE